MKVKKRVIFFSVGNRHRTVSQNEDQKFSYGMEKKTMNKNQVGDRERNLVFNIIMRIFMNIALKTKIIIKIESK